MTPERGDQKPCKQQHCGGQAGQLVKKSLRSETETDAVFGSINQNSKKKNLILVWRLKSRRNKKRIATAACKSRDESNELN